MHARWIAPALAVSALVGCGGEAVKSVKIVMTPRLLGINGDAAEARIFKAGLCVGPSHIEPTNGANYVVIDQLPAPGTPVPANSDVAYTIGVQGPGARIIDETGWPKRCRG